MNAWWVMALSLLLGPSYAVEASKVCVRAVLKPGDLNARKVDWLSMSHATRMMEDSSRAVAPDRDSLRYILKRKGSALAGRMSGYENIRVRPVYEHFQKADSSLVKSGSPIALEHNGRSTWLSAMNRPEDAELLAQSIQSPSDVREAWRWIVHYTENNAPRAIALPGTRCEAYRCDISMAGSALSLRLGMRRNRIKANQVRAFELVHTHPAEALIGDSIVGQGELIYAPLLSPNDMAWIERFSTMMPGQTVAVTALMGIRSETLTQHTYAVRAR